MQKIKLENKVYSIIDSIQNFMIADSFISNKNKLLETTGNGESKLHIGTYSGDNIGPLSKFFEYDKWGIEYFDPERNNWKTFKAAELIGAVIQNKTCFFSKQNLLNYLEDCKEEYFNQEQVYRNDIKQYFEDRFLEANKISTDLLYFSIYDASDSHSQTQSRGYIRSDDNVWKLFRDLTLPKISYLSILKLKEDGSNNSPVFYFRLILDYNLRSFRHPSKEKLVDNIPHSKPTPKSQPKRQNREIDQVKFKKEVHELMPLCPFTKISDERLLTASHIKPYIVCKNENKLNEASDPTNGLSLTPTWDRLFDKGYITFKDNGELICGTQISKYTWTKLGVDPSAKNKYNLITDRSFYLRFHRENVFIDRKEVLL